MNKENITYMSIIIAALIVLVIISIYAMEYSQEKTNLAITTDSNLHNGDLFNLKLTGSYNNPITNKSVEIIVTDALGEKNSFNATTDVTGEISFGMNVTPGVYNFNCVFGEDNHYMSSSTSQNISVCDY